MGGGKGWKGGMGKQRASVGLEGAEGSSISRRSNRSFSVDSKAFPKFKKPIPPRSILSSREYPKI
jgi:hypothetical protein